MKRHDPEASVVVVAEEDSGDDDETAPELTTTATAKAKPTNQQQFKPLPRSSPAPLPPPRSQIPASLRVSTARLEALTNSGPLSPTAATIGAVAADARLVALLDDAEVMESVFRISRDPGLFEKELRLLSGKGKGDRLVELYRRMAAVAAKRCEAFCEEEKKKEEKEKEKEGKEVGDKGAKEKEKETEKEKGAGARANDLRSSQQQTRQPRAVGIEVLR
jgi:hypothetical protein